MVTKNIADFALEYRFFVKGFYEGSDKKPYSLGKAGSIDWNKNASVGEEYLKQLHRHQWFIPQAKVYRVSGDEKYIKSWIESTVIGLLKIHNRQKGLIPLHGGNSK